MKYNPKIHHRRSIRLQNYDYSQTGAYFVTICVRERVCLFGDIADGVMRVNDIGGVISVCWTEISSHFPTVDLDASVIMPNHVHGIIVLTNDAKSVMDEEPPKGEETPEGEETSPLRRPTLGQVVAYFKYQSTKRVNQQRGNPGTRLWQRNYYEHVIRDDADLQNLREYIVYNPLKWELDQLHPDNPSKW